MGLKSYDLSRRLLWLRCSDPRARPLFRASKIANFHARIKLRPALRIAKWQQELALVVGEGAAIDCGCALCLIRVRRAVLGPAYFAALTIAIPQGPSPTLMRRSSLRDFRSTTETSFDAPLAV